MDNASIQEITSCHNCLSAIMTSRIFLAVSKNEVFDTVLKEQTLKVQDKNISYLGNTSHKCFVEHISQSSRL